MTTKLNYKNLRKDDNVTLVDYIDNNKNATPALCGGIPLKVKAVSLPFVYINPVRQIPDGVIDTRRYSLMRISKNAVNTP